MRSLRKMREMSQEEFAEKLDVSRQAVSKWESGEAYPETEKIIAICDLFDCDMDELVRGEITKRAHDNPVAKENYDQIMTQAIRGTTLGFTIILLGISLMLTVQGILPEQNHGGVIGAIIVLVSVILALPFIVISKTRARNFSQHNPTLTDIYEDDSATLAKIKYTKIFAVGVGIILLEAICELILLATNIVTGNLAVAILMYFVTVGESLVFYASKMSGKYDLEKYNFQNTPECRKKVAWARKNDGVIMISAAIIFVIWGSVADNWEMNWIVFLVAVLLCVIVNLVMVGRGRRLR